MKQLDLLRMVLEFDFLHDYKAEFWQVFYQPCSDNAFSARAVHTSFDNWKKLELQFGRLEEVILLDTLDTPGSALFITSMVLLQVQSRHLHTFAIRCIVEHEALRSPICSSNVLFA